MNTIHLAMACDDRYALPLAVAVRSLLEQLEPTYRLELTVVGDGISPENQQRCQSAWQFAAVQCQWLPIQADLLAGVPVTDKLPLPTYYRLLLPDLLPECSKVLYLDPDILVRRSVHTLWNFDLADRPIAAAQDLACPFVHFRSAMPNFQLARRYLLGCDPIPNYRELNLQASTPYFNAGVMLMNLELWRRERLGQRLIEFTRTHAEHNVSADQYSLNAMLAERRLPLDGRWNQLQAIYDYPGWRESPFDKQTFRRLRAEPWIAHFAGPGKPWESGSRHPLRSEYYAILDRTPWRGWRPPPLTLPISRRVRKSWRKGRDWVGARLRRVRYPLVRPSSAA